MGNRIQNIRKVKVAQQHGHCFYCRQPMWEGDSGQFAKCHSLSPSKAGFLRATAKHLKARQDGGRDTKQNIVAACSYCNHHRHKERRPKETDDFAQKVRSRLAQGKWHGIMIARI